MMRSLLLRVIKLYSQEHHVHALPDSDPGLPHLLSTFCSEQILQVP